MEKYFYSNIPKVKTPIINPDKAISILQPTFHSKISFEDL